MLTDRHGWPLAFALAAALLIGSQLGAEEPAGITDPATLNSVQATNDSVDYGKVGYAHISRAIDRTRHRYLERVIKSAREQQLDTLIVKIDTDGGEVFYAREMLKLVLDQARDGPRMIAFVDFRAISAGAMIAYGHEAIYMTDTGSIGDIGVIFVAPGGEMKYAPEKVETVVRTLLVQAAETRGWSRGLLLKMTARNQELYRITLPDGETEYVIEDDLPDFLVRHPDIDEENREHVIVFRGEDRLLTLTGREAVKLGMATDLVPSLDALYARLGVEPAQVVDLAPTAVENLASYLAGVAPLLAGLALMFILFELKTPGVGIWALLGGVFGALFLLSQYFLDMANNMEVVLMALGMALVMVEFFTMVGGGAIGVAGGLLLFAGLAMAFLPNEFHFDPGDERYLHALGNAALSSMMSMGIMAAGIVAFIYALPRSGLAHRLSVRSEIRATSAGRLEEAAGELVGSRGTARDRLRPSGIVIVAGEDHSARAEHGEFVDAGAPVEVVDVQFGELVVRPVEPSSTTDAASSG